MKAVSARSVVTLALLLMVVVALVPGCARGGGPSLPIQVGLSFSEPPVLGKPVQLTATFKLRIEYQDAPDIMARIVLPEGFEKVSGDLEWRGNFVRGNTYTITTTVRSVKTGDWEIVARADSFRSDGMGGYAAAYVSVSESDANISDRPPTSGGISTPLPTEPPTPGPSANAPSLPVKVEVFLSEPPILGKLVQITATFDLAKTYYRDANNVTARLILPPGFEKVDGALEWKGDFIRGNTYSLSLTTVLQ